MTIRDEDLKPFEPLPKHKTDGLTYAVRFGCGAMLGVVMSVILFGGFLRVHYRRAHRRSIGLGEFAYYEWGEGLLDSLTMQYILIVAPIIILASGVIFMIVGGKMRL